MPLTAAAYTIHNTAPAGPQLSNFPDEIKRVLECEDKWDFDVMSLERLTEKRYGGK